MQNAYQHDLKITAKDALEWLKSGAMISSGTEKTIIMGWGQARWSEFAPLGSVKTDGHAKDAVGFYFPDFFLQNKKAWIYFEKNTTISLAELLNLLEGIQLDPPTPITWQKPAKAVFTKEFEALQKAFSTGELEKAVLYLFSKSADPLSCSHQKRAIEHVLNYVLNTNTFAYGFWEGNEGTIGATPEILFHTQEKARPELQTLELQTMALAGTQQTGPSTELMLQDPKLLHEHQIVVDDIAKRLESLGKVHIGQLQRLVLPNLTHLYTPIEVQLSKLSDFSTYISLLHPTPALGGFPRESAWQWLLLYNQIIPRHRFGAPVGYYNSSAKRMACYVGIRNVQWIGNTLLIGAGCGLVTLSNLETEWQEMLLKMDSIQKFLNLE